MATKNAPGTLVAFSLGLVTLASLIFTPGTLAALPDPASVARGVAQEVGLVGKAVVGPRGPVYVFEEFHTSRVGQLQIAIMFLRLYDRHGLRVLGQEGVLQRPEPLNATWFHKMGGHAAGRTREDVAVRMLAEGEIRAGEFMALLFPDFRVFGTEDQDYNVQLKEQVNPEFLKINSRLMERNTVATNKY